MTVESNQGQVSNESIQVEFEHRPGCQVMMLVKVNPEATNASRKKAIKAINKEVSIPGFRKGKAPEAIIVKNYGKHLKQEWHEVLLNTAFDESTRLLKVYPFTKSSVKKAKVEECSSDDGAKLHFEFESYPEIPQVDFEGLELTSVETKEVTEKDVEESVERIREMCKTVEEVKDCPVKEGDFIDIDVNVSSALGEAVEDGEACTNKRFTVSESEMEPWLYELVVGMNVGEVGEREKELDGDEDSEKEMRKYQVKVNQISHSVLPEANDELAEKVGSKDFEDMKEKLRERLINEAENEKKNQMGKQLDDILLEKYPFEIPKSLFEAERRVAVKDKISKLKSEKRDEEAILKEKEKIEEEASRDVTKKLCLLFLMQKISDEEGIQVSNEELNAKLSANAVQLAMGGWDKKTDKEKQQVYAYFSSLLMEEKVKDFLIKKAKFV